MSATRQNNPAPTLRWMVLIPAYNEQATIQSLVQNVLQQQPTQLLVVDDASEDQTAAILQAMVTDQPDALQVIHNSKNLGKAGSLWVGFDQAMALQMDVVITLDGDGQHRAQDIPALLAEHLGQPQRLIIGAREKNLKTQPLGRFLANRFANFWISWAAGYAVADSQSGFRLYPTSLLKRITALRHSEGFVFESEVIIEAAWQGCYTSTVTIPSIYQQHRRPSHFKPWSDIIKITRMVARRLASKKFYLQGLLATIGHKPPPYF